MKGHQIRVSIMHDIISDLGPSFMQYTSFLISGFIRRVSVQWFGTLGRLQECIILRCSNACTLYIPVYINVHMHTYVAYQENKNITFNKNLDLIYFWQLYMQLSLILRWLFMLKISFEVKIFLRNRAVIYLGFHTTSLMSSGYLLATTKWTYWHGADSTLWRQRLYRITATANKAQLKHSSI